MRCGIDWLTLSLSIYSLKCLKRNLTQITQNPKRKLMSDDLAIYGQRRDYRHTGDG